MRKRRGTFVIALGLLLLVAAAGLTAYNLYQELAGGRQADAVMEELDTLMEDVPIHAVQAGPAAEYEAANDPANIKELDGRYYMGVISLPTLGLQLPVQQEWSYPNLRVSPCRMTGSPAAGDLVILAHNYRTHFGQLNQLEIGDEVSVTLLDGATYIYQVNAKEIVPPTAVESVTSGEWPLTLFTCTMGGRTRVVVRCDFANQGK